MAKRIKVLTPRGVKSILTGDVSILEGSSDVSSSSFTETKSLTTSAVLITHNKNSKAVAGYYKDSSGWNQELRVNTVTADPLNSVYVYSGKTLTDVDITITF